jgi:hypothetical protein
MRRAIDRVRPALLVAVGLTLAACAVAPAPSGYYGPADYYAYGGPPFHSSFDFGYGGGWHHGWDHGWHHDGRFEGSHFAHVGGHGFAHVGGGGHHG